MTFLFFGVSDLILNTTQECKEKHNSTRTAVSFIGNLGSNKHVQEESLNNKTVNKSKTCWVVPILSITIDFK